MTTTELTVILKQLNESERIEVGAFVEKLLARRRSATPKLEKLTVTKLLKIVDKSDKEAKSGNLVPYSEIRERISKKYVLSS